MGTRGLFGFRYKGEDKLSYNHWDSYPDGKGADFLEQIRQFSVDEIKQSFERTKLVKPDDEPTKEELEKYEKYTDTHVGRSAEDKEPLKYYQILRELQGNMVPIFNGEVDVMINSNDFIKDSLFCEWAYIINLDTGKLEVWEGYQQTTQKGNRYGEEPNEDGYNPCRLVIEYDLNNLPSREEFLKDFVKEERE